jgi:hypothetical membrane protein
MVGAVWGILVVLLATLAYLPDHPDFSLFTTYLSDIGDAPGWPQVLFNSGTLISAPIRYLVLVLLVLRLSQLGAGSVFAGLVLVVGALATFGTILMTAVPFSTAPAVHKSGIPLYFFGVVVLQTVIGAREWTLDSVPRVLPWICFGVVAVFLVFATLMVLHGRGVVGRSAPVPWEWLCFVASIVWLLAHSVLLGKEVGRSEVAQGGPA